GIIPGLLTAIGYMITVFIYVKLRPEVAPQVKEVVPLKEKFESIKYTWPMLLLIVAVIVAIYTGIVTPTEAGALGAFVAFLIALAMRRLTVQKVNQALSRTLRSTTMILFIVIGAMIFSYFVTVTQVTQNIISFVQASDISKWVVLAAVV